MKKRSMLFFSVMILSITANAQMGGILYSSSKIPQMNTQNPAFYPSDNKFYISLPSVSWNFVSPISYNDLVTYNSEKGENEINLNNVVDHHGNGVRSHLDMDAMVLGGGFKMDNWFMTFSAQAKATLDIGITKGLLDFLNAGNYAIKGEAESLDILDGDLLSTQVYTEYAIGGGYTFFDKLTVGAKVKLLEGYADLRTNDSYVKLYTADDMSSIKADVYYNLITSSPLEDGETDVFPKNFGVAFDFGAKYEWNGFEFSASVLDLGKGIHWNDNVKQRFPSDGAVTFDFSGVPYDGSIGDGEFRVDTTSSSYRHTIEQLTDFRTEDCGDYWTKLPTKLNIGVMYSPLNMLKVGVLYHGEVDHNAAGYNNLGEIVHSNKLRSSASVMACANVLDWLEIMVCNAVVSDGKEMDWFNPGIGLNVSAFRTFQIYFAIDYISDIRLLDAKQLKAGLGINLLFGHGKKARASEAKSE